MATMQMMGKLNAALAEENNRVLDLLRRVGEYNLIKRMDPELYAAIKEALGPTT